MVSEFENLLMSCVLLDEEASQSLKLSLCLPVTPQKPHKVKLKTP